MQVGIIDMKDGDDMTGSGNDNIIWSVVDGETVLLDVSSGRYYSLNGTATAVWTSLQQGESEAHIVDALSRAYGVDRTAVRQDVAELIEALRAQKLWN